MCSKYEHVLITGDANAYTATLPDFTEFDEYLTSYLDLDEETECSLNQINQLNEYDIPKDRSSKCTKINKSGRRLLEICKSNNLFILNGRIGKDRHAGNYTFRALSVIDYSIASTKLVPLFIDFEIIEMDSIFSDGHCLMSLQLVLSQNSQNNDKNKQNQHIKRRWDDSKCDEFYK